MQAMDSQPCSALFMLPVCLCTESVCAWRVDLACVVNSFVLRVVVDVYGCICGLCTWRVVCDDEWLCVVSGCVCGM